MSLFGDLKRVFFGAKAVTKNQARKAGDAIGEATDELADTTRELARDVMEKAPGVVNQGKEALEDLADKVWREADAAVDKGRELKDQASDALNEKLHDLRRKDEVLDPVDPTSTVASRLGRDTPTGAPATPPKDDPDGLDLERDFGNLTVSEPADAPKSGKINWEEGLVEAKDQAAKTLNKANELATPALDAAAKAGLAAKARTEEIAEAVGKQVREKGDAALNRAAEIGAEMKGKFDDFVDHANVEAEKMKAEEAIQKAKLAAEQAEARARAFDGKETDRDTDESLLDGTDSFFERADRFAKGDYHNEGGKEMTIGKNPKPPIKPEGGLIDGFEDHDGDGDSLIDDAIVEDE